MTPRVVHNLLRGWALALTVLLLWPQRLSGYGLGRDMVFTPQQPLGPAALGVSSAPPRAVPVDAVVALLEHLVDGAVLGRLALAAPLLLAGLGAAALLADAAPAARFAACGFAIWNPFVVERLALGQWSLLWGYAALFWIVRVLARDDSHRLLRLVPPVAAASLTPTGGLFAVLVVGAVAMRKGRGGLRPLVVTAALQLPWLVAAALSTATGTSDSSGVAAFASRSEFGGVLTSLLGLGGIWNAAVVPPSRDGVLALVAAGVVLGAGVLGWRTLRRALGTLFTPLVAVAAVGFVLAIASALPGTDAVMRGLAGGLPGGGLLRDAQKWLAPFVVLAVLLFGAAADVVARRLRTPAVLLVALVLPLALLPDATRAVWPTVTPVHYPAGYAAVSEVVARGGGDVAVVPFQPYRSFAWAGDRPSFDPATRLLDATVVTDDRLLVGRRLLPGEDPRADRVGGILAADRPARLADAGIGWVLVERRTPGELPRLDGLQQVLSTADVTLYRVPGPVRDVGPSAWRVAVAATVFGLWTLLVLVASLTLALAALRRRRRHRRVR